MRFVERMFMVLLGAAILGLAPPAPAETLRLDLQRCQPLEIEAPLEVAVLPAQGGMGTETLTWTVDVEPDARTVVVESGTEVELSQVSVAGSNLWARPVSLQGGDRATVVAVWPSSAVIGQLRVPRSETPPEEMTAWLSPLATARRAKEGPCGFERLAAPCRVEEGKLSCDLPAGTWNVMLKAEGWAASHLWDLELQPGKAHSLGSLDLRHGATLSGQVTTVDGFADPRITRVWAVPAGTLPRRLRLEDLGLGRYGPAAEINEQGYFVFEDLTPGAYVVVAHQPGLALHDRLRVVLEVNRETALRDPIVLTYPTRIVAEVDPAHDLAGEPWEVRVYRQEVGGSALDLVASGRTQEGIWEDASLLSGDHYVAVFDSQGTAWARQGPLAVRAGGDLYLPIQLELVTVEGVVTLGDEVVEGARIWFGRRSGEVSLSTETDEDGRYGLTLPRAGDWALDLHSEDWRLFHSTEVTVPEDGGEVDLELPDTRLRGRVVTADGNVPNPLPSVMVNRLGGHGSTLPIEVSADGDFESRGMLPGTYVAHAESPRGTSEVVTVSVAEEVEAPELTLVLRPSATFAGRVLAGPDGVAGARLWVIPLSADGRLLDTSSPSLTTDAAGRFETRVPAEADRLHTIVMPPGHGLTVVSARLETAVIQVAPAQGSLRLQGLAEQGALAVMTLDGAAVPAQLLGGWAAMNGGSTSSDELELPSMPAGAYRLCRLDPSELPPVLARLAAPTRCEEGVLAPGASLTLTLP